MSIVIKEGDESAFIAYEEAFIHHLQHYWTTQPEMEAIPVIDIAASIEDVLYTEILKKHALPPTATLWSRSECILAFVDRVEKVKRCLDSKRCTQWKKLFETHAKHPMQILKVIQAEEVEKVSKPKVTKVRVPHPLCPLPLLSCAPCGAVWASERASPLRPSSLNTGPPHTSLCAPVPLCSLPASACPAVHRPSALIPSL